MTDLDITISDMEDRERLYVGYVPNPGDGYDRLHEFRLDDVKAILANDLDGETDVLPALKRAINDPDYQVIEDQ